MTFNLQQLRRRLVEIDYLHKHRHLPGSLSALPIIVSIYERMSEHDVFILSKGHSCAALYAVLEALGKKPNVTLVHPERDVENGVTITAGSLGHGLPIAVGMAYAKRIQDARGMVNVLMGDGECQEGTTWEALHLARRLKLHYGLTVYVDYNGYQGSERLLSDCCDRMAAIFPVKFCKTKKGEGVTMFEEHPEKSVHLVTETDFENINQELSI
jgi:transketolase